MHVELARLHLQQFLSHNSFAECLNEKKNRQHFHHPSAYYYSRESKSRWYVTAIRIYYVVRSLNPGVRNARRPENYDFSLVIVNCDICQQETGISKHFREKWLTCMPAPCRVMLTALAPFSVVIRRIMMQNVFCFSANDLWNKNCCKCNLASSTCIFFRFWALLALHVEFC